MRTLVQMFAKGIVVKCLSFAQECLKWFWKQNQGWGEDGDERMKGIVARSPHANALLPWLSGYFSPRGCRRHWRYCESWAFQTLPLLLHRKGIPAAAKGQLPGWLVVYNVESTGQMRRWLNWGQSGPSLPLPPPRVPDFLGCFGRAVGYFIGCYHCGYHRDLTKLYVATSAVHLCWLCTVRAASQVYGEIDPCPLRRSMLSSVGRGRFP